MQRWDVDSPVRCVSGQQKTIREDPITQGKRNKKTNPRNHDKAKSPCHLEWFLIRRGSPTTDEEDVGERRGRESDAVHTLSRDFGLERKKLSNREKKSETVHSKKKNHLVSREGGPQEVPDPPALAWNSANFQKGYRCDQGPSRKSVASLSLQVGRCLKH